MTGLTQTGAHQLFGIYEIDTEGVVFYYRSLSKNPVQKNSLIGHNFFDAIACFSNAGEFQYHLRRFVREAHPTDEFKMVFCCDKEKLASRIKLARLKERESDGSRNLIIVDIREA